TLIDLPGGSPTTVEAATGSPGALLASMQATLDQRIPHYLISSDADLQSLIDRMGGIPVLVEESFVWQGQTWGPGETTLPGGAAMEYLRSAAPLDATGRWEGVLTGCSAPWEHRTSRSGRSAPWRTRSWFLRC